MRLILLRGALFINLVLIHLSSPIGKLCLIPLVPSCPWIDLIVLLKLVGVEPGGLLVLDVVLLLLIIHLLLQLLILIMLLCCLLCVCHGVGIEELLLLR
jgi:hypothetical protein